MINFKRYRLTRMVDELSSLDNIKLGTFMFRQSVTNILLQNVLFCSLIAVFLWQLVPSYGQYGFIHNFVHAQAIGNCIAGLVIVANRLIHIQNRYFFFGIVLAVTPLGVFLGLRIASWLLDANDQQTVLLTDPNVVMVSAGTAVIASVIFYWHLRNREHVLQLELIASEEKRRADHARHAMLQAQLEPHMLFNTLANLRALINTDTERAVEMLDRMDDFLRETLSSSQASSHTVAHEFKILKDYLGLMKIRLDKRLTYKLELSPNCAELTIPSLLLQPLVENAIRHGIEPKIEGGLITVSAHRAGNTLTMIVEDTGVGMDQPQTGVWRASARKARRENKRNRSTRSAASGIGLSNLRERLQQSFGEEATIKFESNTDENDQGVTVTLQVPISKSTRKSENIFAGKTFTVHQTSTATRGRPL